MITKEELIEIARITRLSPYQQEKHYIQALVLNSIYSTITNQLVFKGGTAVFFFYRLNRFSEDLDFTLREKINKQLIIDNIQRDLNNFGINHKISNIIDHEVSMSFRVDAEGPLFTKEIERCYIKIEISKREEVFSYVIKEFKSIYPDIPNFSLCLMSQEEILAEKFRTILTRQQARDLYDLYFLLNDNVKINIDLINKKLSYYSKTFNRKEFIQRVKNLKDIWGQELKPFVIGSLPEFSTVQDYVLKVIK